MRSTRAWRRSGTRSFADFNVPDPNGYGYRQGTIWKGRRVSTASAYLKPAMTRRNLEVLTRDADATRVCSTASVPSASKMQARDGIKRLRGAQGGRRLRGTFHSPHLLLHSGIGDERDLKSWGITPVHHLPAVGRHLRDHPAAPIAMETDDSTSYGHSWKALPRNVAQMRSVPRDTPRSSGEQPVRNQRLYPDAAGIRPSGLAARVPARAAQPAAVSDSARPRLCDRHRVSLSQERGAREPVPARTRSPSRSSIPRSAATRPISDTASRTEDGANDLRARELQAVSRARGVARPRGLVRRAVARAHQTHAHDRAPSGLDVPHGARRRQRRRPRAQGARARAAPGRRCLDLSAPRGREHECERRGDRGEGVRYDLGKPPPAPIEPTA